MDSVSLDQLFHELRSADAEKDFPCASDLGPGLVLASGVMDRHVIAGTPTRHPASRTLCFPVRHIHGGHTVPYVVGERTQVFVYTARISASTVSEVPEVPLCAIPEAPATGDRIVQQPYSAHAFGVAVYREYTGQRWESPRPSGADPLSTPVMRRLVRPHSDGHFDGWYVYLPAGERPYLYADGRPVPARSADTLVEGDVFLVPGGGRLQVEHLTRRRAGCSLSLRVLTVSRHEMRHLTWASEVGHLIEHHDSGVRGYLYPTEPRAGELLPVVGEPASKTA